ncbi:kelch repeat and BTB domain-containing protein 13-like [Branchiostoma floridae x Branchiostoma japonicum]
MKLSRFLCFGGSNLILRERLRRYLGPIFDPVRDKVTRVCQTTVTITMEVLLWTYAYTHALLSILLVWDVTPAITGRKTYAPSPLDQRRKPQRNSDVVILVDEYEFEANKAILSEKSEYFRAMFGSGMKESNQRILTLHGVPAAIFDIIIDCVHGSPLAVTDENLADLVAAASFLQMPCVITGCVFFLRANMDVDNCTDVLALAEMYGVQEIIDEVHKFMRDNYIDFCKSESYQLLSPEKREYLKTLRNSGKQYIGIISKEGAMRGLQVDPDDVKKLHYYDEEQDKWKLLANLPVEVSRWNCSIAVIDNYLYVVGGFKPRTGDSCFQYLPGAYRYNPCKNSWEEIRAMRKRRRHFSLVPLEGALYAIGGWWLDAFAPDARSRMFDSIEKYDPESDRWSIVTTLPLPRYRVHMTLTHDNPLAVAFDSSIFILLAYRGIIVMHQYTPSTDKWREVCEVPFHNDLYTVYTMLSLDDVIYIIGGNFEENLVVSYRPETDEWTKLSSVTRVAYFNGSATLRGRKIYIGTAEDQTLQVYDVDTNTWHPAGGATMPFLGPLVAFTLSLG